MHMQKSEPGWIDALLRMPDGSVVKGFDGGLLMEAKLKWAAAGRAPGQLTTVLRHDNVQTSPRGATWEEAQAHWRAMYWRFIDGTYLRELAPFVDVVSEANEYWTATTWTDPDGGAGVKRSMLAAQAVWNDEFRGRTVTNPHDGGHGTIPAHCRIALGAVTVTHWWPRDLLQATIDGDNIADIHCYMKCANGQRQADDWLNHSGLFNTHEQAYGLKPRWLFGESGPYWNTEDGWRAASCLNGDEDRLVQLMGEWFGDITTTTAYREGRLVGAGAWFTSGHVGWEKYQLETRQLIRLADTLNPVWRPGTGDDEMADLAQVRADALTIRSEATVALGRVNEMRANLDTIILKADAIVAETNTGPEPLFQVRIIVGALNVRSGPAVSFNDIGDVLKDAVLPVYEVHQPSGWYRIDAAESKWISGSDSYSVRV